MATPTAITVTLDREREIRGGPRVRARLNSLARPPRRPGIYAFCAQLWAMLVDDTGLPEPEDLAEYLVTPEQIAAAGKAIQQANEENEGTAKNGKSSKQRPAPASSSR